MSTATILAEAVARRGADTVFGLPGGGPNLEVIGAAEAAGLRFVLAHGETAGCIMAATYGLLTGRPAMAIATRGPGAACAANGAAQATLDRFPLLLVTDCVPESDRDRVAHQRLDQRAMLAPVTKWSGRLGGDAEGPALAAAALDLAGAAPRGAVHLDFDPQSSSSTAPQPTPVDPVAEESVERARAALGDSQRPVVIVGLGAIDDADTVRRAVEHLGCPVLTTYQAAGLLPDGHRQAAGLYTSGAIERPALEQADLIIAIGLDTVEPMPTPWTLRTPTLVLTATEPASSFVPNAIEVRGPIGELVERIICDTPIAPGWSDNAGAEALATARETLAIRSSGGFGPLELVATVCELAPPNALATVDAGAHFLAVMPFWPTREPLGLLISNGLATMGFALPGAIAAALARPGRPVVCLVGDGGLGMTLAELETVARLRLPITIVVFNDAALSLIEIKQRPNQGGSNAVHYQSTDFAAVAIAMGLDGTTVSDTEGLRKVLSGGWNSGRLIDARVDPAVYGALIRATRG